MWPFSCILHNFNLWKIVSVFRWNFLRNEIVRFSKGTHRHRSNYNSTKFWYIFHFTWKFIIFWCLTCVCAWCCCFWFVCAGDRKLHFGSSQSTVVSHSPHIFARHAAQSHSTHMPKWIPSLNQNHQPFMCQWHTEQNFMNESSHYVASIINLRKRNIKEKQWNKMG